MAEKKQLSNMLQNRHCESDIKNRNRNRRGNTSTKREKGTRSKKNNTFNEVWVENIEIYKPGSENESFKNYISDKNLSNGYIEFYDFEVEDCHEYFANGILVHNCHHVSSLSGTYGKALLASSAKMRIAVTATLPEEQESKMALHALIGPVLEEVTMKEAADKGMLVLPTVHFLTYKPPLKDYDLRSYTDVYDRYVTRNGRRNDLILDLVEKHIAEKKGVLIGVKQIVHLQILVEKAERRGIKIYGAQGKTPKDERLEIINKMKSGEYLCAVATKVWSEGINIPKLEIIINAAAGKSPIENLQRPGRGTRNIEGKSELLFYDFIDPLRYLAEHSCERMKIYSEQGWKITVSEPFVSGILSKDA